MTDTQRHARVIAILYLLSALIVMLLSIQNYRYGLFELVYSASFLLVLFLGVSAYARFAPEALHLRTVCYWSLVAAMLLIIIDSFAFANEVKHWLYPLGLISFIALSYRDAMRLNVISASTLSLILLWQHGLVSALAYLAIYSLMISLSSTYAKLHQRHSRSLVELEIRDPVTGAYNFRHLEDTLGKEICRADRTGKSLALISLEIDYLPQILDLHGTVNTNDLTLQFSQTLRAMIRAGDSEYCNRNRTFYLILPCTPSEGVVVIAERIRRTIEENSWPVVDSITVSLGCATYIVKKNKAAEKGKSPIKGEHTTNRFINDANIALVEAQKNGHNRVCHHG